MWGACFSEPLKPGTAPPELGLPDEAGRAVRLAELRGRGVGRVFCPRDETPGRRAQLCEFRDRWAAEAQGIAAFKVNPQSGA
jgi:peroxiredoxin